MHCFKNNSHNNCYRNHVNGPDISTNTHVQIDLSIFASFGTQDAEVTKSLFRSSILINHQSKFLNNVIIDCGKCSIDYCGKKVKFHTTIRNKLVETLCPKGHFRGLLASKGKNEAFPSQLPPCNVVHIATMNL